MNSWINPWINSWINWWVSLRLMQLLPLALLNKAVLPLKTHPCPYGLAMHP